VRSTKTSKGEQHRSSQARFRVESGYTNCIVTSVLSGKEKRVGARQTTSLWKQLLTSKVRAVVTAVRHKRKASPKRTTVVGSFCCDRSWSMVKQKETFSSLERTRTSSSPHCGVTPKSSTSPPGLRLRKQQGASRVTHVLLFPSPPPAHSFFKVLQ